MPFSRLRLVEDAVDSPLFDAVGRFVRLAVDDKDETFVLRGILSIDDCDEAVGGKLY